MRGEEILKLHRECKAPVRLRWRNGGVYAVTVVAQISEMSTAEFSRFCSQIQERAHWGTMEIEEKEDGRLIVTWERSVK